MQLLEAKEIRFFVFLVVFNSAWPDRGNSTSSQYLLPSQPSFPLCTYRFYISCQPGSLPRRVRLSYLDETNVRSLLPKALTADVQTVFADETGAMGADSAVVIELVSVLNLSKLFMSRIPRPQNFHPPQGFLSRFPLNS
jgi:hypothetical protein